MGGDSFQNLPKWKNFETLVKNYRFIVYRREGFDISNDYGAEVLFLEAPLLQLSATLIRNNRKRRNYHSLFSSRKSERGN
jgi:nicotinate-nucleotide adenylyltransferase